LTKFSTIARAVGLALIAMAAGAESAHGQFRSATIFTSYSAALTTRPGVTEAKGWGGGLELQFDVTPQIGVSLSGFYEYLSVEQPNALEEWNWDFWIQRYRGIVQANLASDPNLSATLVPDVVTEGIPVYLSASFALEPLPAVRLRPYAGAGVYFYTKKMYLLEQWSKYFPDVDYTLTYDYRNFAPPKRGNPFLGVAGFDLSVRIVEMLELGAGVRYMHILSSAGSRGSDELPMENSLSVRLVLGFVY